MDNGRPGKRGLTGRLKGPWKDLVGTWALIGLVLLLVLSPIYLLYLLFFRRGPAAETEDTSRNER